MPKTKTEMKTETETETRTENLPAPQAMQNAETGNWMLDVTGVRGSNAQLRLLEAAVGSLDPVNRSEGTLATLVEIKDELKPRDPLEGMLIDQMIGIHFGALTCLRCAAHPNVTQKTRASNLRSAEKLSTIFRLQMQALDKHRGRGQSKAAFRDVNVAPGAQAIVANFESGSALTGRQRCEAGYRGFGRERRTGSCRRSSTGRRSTTMKKHKRNTGPMLASKRCRAKTRSGRPCASPAVRGKKRCRMHGGAKGSGAPFGNTNALKHGYYSKRWFGFRRDVAVLLRQAKELLDKVE